MQPIFFRFRFLAGALGAIVAASSGLAACGSSNQTQAQATNPTTRSADPRKPIAHSQQDHGSMSGMNHSLNLGPADADFDLRFIDSMIPHHQGAVEMAQSAKQHSKRPEIQKLAAAILQAQTPEINQMKQWRQAWYPQASTEPVAWNAQMGHLMPMTPDQKQSMRMSLDLGTADANFDLRFLNAMIPHHEAALTMAEMAVKQSQRPEMQQLAQTILKSQAAEISQMQQWKQAWYQQ